MPARLETQPSVTPLDRANALRALAMDAVQRANSGHPGMPMGMADIAEVLWNEFLVHNPADPAWPGRDRFVLSNGHGSMLIYGLLHLSGYALSLDDLKAFRQFGSKTPGHPERGHTPGIETTTGPLGQGLANAVGMALAERLLAAEFNPESPDDWAPIDHYTYVFAGDGCLMEGISHEACSLAGTLGLGRLIVFYDDNSISIDGDVRGWFRDDTPARFESYGWQVVRNVNGHDAAEIRQSIITARDQQARPTLICCKTVIGFGSPNREGTGKAHGAPLGDAEIALTRERLGWPHAPFEIPAEIAAAWDATERGAAAQHRWNLCFEAYAEKFPGPAKTLLRRLSGELPEDWPATIAAAIAAAGEVSKPTATRKLSEQVLDLVAPHLPELIGGSADLSESNNTFWKGASTIAPGQLAGNYISYGVREFGMSAIMNGLALHGGFIPFGGTFLVFSDYARNAIRMAALMQLRTIFVLSHDSIGLGEDGPTHQPVEQIASLRLIPRLHVWRPADAVETAFAWRAAIERRDGPTALVLSRQNLPPQPHPPASVAAARGGYVLLEPEQPPVAIVIATGSEVLLAMEAARRLAAEGRPIRVVSMPCLDVFLEQDAIWRESVLPRELTRRLVIEAGATGGWWRIAGSGGVVLGLDDFGHSAPAPQVFAAVGLGIDRVTATLRELL